MIDLPLYEHRAVRQRAVQVLSTFLPVDSFLRLCKDKLLCLEAHSPNRVLMLQHGFDAVSRTRGHARAASNTSIPTHGSSGARCLNEKLLLEVLQECALGDSVKKARLQAVKLLSQVAQWPAVLKHLQGIITTVLAAKACDPHPPVRYVAMEALCPLLQPGRGTAVHSGAEEGRIAGVIARLLRLAGHPACDEAAPPHVRQAVAETTVSFLRGGKPVVQGGRLLAKAHATRRLALLLAHFKTSEHSQVGVLLQPLLPQLV